MPNVSSAYQTARLQLSQSGQSPPTGPQGQTSQPRPLTQTTPTTAPRPDMARQKALSSQGATQVQTELTSPKTQQAFGQRLLQENPSALAGRAQQLASTLLQTTLGNQLSQIQGGRQLVGTIMQQSQGKPTAGNLPSGSRLLAQSSQLCQRPEVIAATGQVLAPLAMLDSGAATVDACRKAWDRPNAENLVAAGKSTLKMISDAQATVEMIPGGELVQSGVSSLIEGVVPGAATVALLPKIDRYKDMVKTTKADPTAKNIANLSLETMKLGAAGLAATNIPGLAQIGTVAEFGVGVIQKLVNVDYQKVGKTIKGWFTSLGDAMGIKRKKS